MKLFIFLIFLFYFVHNEVFQFVNFDFRLNSFIIFSNFFLSYNNFISFDFDFPNLFQKNINFYIFLIDYYKLSKFNINLNYNPNICCNLDGEPIICNSTHLLSNYSIFYKKYFINNNITINESITNKFQKTKITGLIFICEKLKENEKNNLFSTEKNEYIKLNGIIKFSNDKNFISYESNKKIYVYIISSIIYLILILKLIHIYYITYYKDKKKCYNYIKLFIFSIPIIVISQIIKIIIEINKSLKGRINIFLLFIESITEVFFDFILKFIYEIISLGFTVNLHLRLYNYNQQNISNENINSKNEFKVFYVLCSIYSLTYIFKNICAYKHFYFIKDKGLLILFNVILYYIDIFIWYSIYLKIKKIENKMKNIFYLYKYFKRFLKNIILYGLMNLMILLIFIIEKINYLSIFFKTLNSIFFEIKNILMFIVLIISLFGNISETKEGYILDPSFQDDNQFYTSPRLISLENIKSE